MDQPPEPTADLLELLQADHSRVGEMIAGSVEPEALVSEITTHLVAESQLLYPAMRRHLPDADVTVDGLLDTDHVLEELLTRLDHGEDGIEGGTLVPELPGLFADHVRHQESLFPALRQAAGSDELRRLGEALGPTVMEAPTHPHPHLPREGPFEVISDAVASSVDHIRDALRREGRDR